jgi:hypothetical protein
MALWYTTVRFIKLINVDDDDDDDDNDDGGDGDECGNDDGYDDIYSKRVLVIQYHTQLSIQNLQ